MNIVYEEKYVAFIDVLGFAELVKSNNKKKLEKYFGIVDSAFSIFDGTRPQMMKLAISDSIILITPNDDLSFQQLLSAIRTLQSALAPSDIWVRGAVTRGPVYYDKAKNNIVGEAFIKAVMLEKEAIYPRVIIDPIILSKMNMSRKEFCVKYNDGPMIGPDKAKLIHDYGLYNRKRFTEDDAIFICYANWLIITNVYQTSDPSIDGVHPLKLVYQHLRKNLYGEQKHYKKYLWLKKYFLEALWEQYTYVAAHSWESTNFLNELISDFTAL